MRAAGNTYSGVQQAFAALFAAATLALVAACTAPQPAGERFVSVKLIAINDFHGHLRPPAAGVRLPASGGAPPAVLPAGGIEQLATLVDRLRAKNRNHLMVSAGDLIGASPLISSLLEDEPTIEAMNLAGLDLSAVGNHEFDRGVDHLKRMQAGGCPQSGCKSDHVFAGAHFKMLAANVVDRSTGETIFPAFAVREFDGVRVGFIGLTLAGTRSLVPAQGIAGIEFADEVQTINRLVPGLKSEGVEAIVVLIHEGAQVTGHFNECEGVSGRLPEIVSGLDPAIDVVISGHTHQAYVCRLSGKLVTSAGSYGRLVTEIDLTLDRATRDVSAATATNYVVDLTLPKNEAETALLAKYDRVAGSLERRVVGRVTTSFSPVRNSGGESQLGRLIADAQLEATERSASASFALMNWGGIRSVILYGSDGTVTYGDAFAVHPFGNTLVTMTLTGREVLQLLEQQWQADGQQILQASRGLSYAWSPDCPAGQHVLRGSVRIQGTSLVEDKAYRVTVNSFLSGGGDRFSVLPQGRDRQTGVLDIDALLGYLERHSPTVPVSDTRIERRNGGCNSAESGEQ